MFVVPPDATAEQTAEVWRARAEAYSDAMHDLIGVIADARSWVRLIEAGQQLTGQQLATLGALMDGRLQAARGKVEIPSREREQQRAGRFTLPEATAARCPRCGDPVLDEDPQGPTLGRLLAAAAAHRCVGAGNGAAQ
jgi:hypothetical protein